MNHKNACELWNAICMNAKDNGYDTTKLGCVAISHNVPAYAMEITDYALKQPKGFYSNDWNESIAKFLREWADALERK